MFARVPVKLNIAHARQEPINAGDFICTDCTAPSKTLGVQSRALLFHDSLGDTPSCEAAFKSRPEIMASYEHAQPEPGMQKPSAHLATLLVLLLADPHLLE